jgi:8-oxo-dGTP diphosphatase
MSERQAVRWADLYAARVSSFGEIEMTDESLGRQAVTIAELPEVYHLWNDLTAMVFEHAYEVVKRMDCHSPSQP